MHQNLMFAPTDPNAPKPDAISAVKALQKASAAGQKIYKITKDNIDQVLPFLQHGQEARNDIIRGVNAGKEVTTHTDAVSIPGGWSGFGYIITDPVLGDGVYKISGGANGGAKGLSEKVNNIISWLGVLSEEVIDSLGPAFAKLLVKLKGAFEKISNFLALLNSCPLGVALAGIITLLFIFSGFGGLATGLGSIPIIGPALAIGVGIVGAVVAGEVFDGFIKRCK